MEELTSSFQKHTINDKQVHKRPKYGGRLPADWIDCPKVGDSLIEGFILPVKVPLHANFRSKCGSKKWEVSDLLRATQNYGKKAGMVVDLTDTHRYYNPDDFQKKGIGTVFTITTLYQIQTRIVKYCQQCTLSNVLIFMQRMEVNNSHQSPR